jgi:hypothetical protein
LKCPDRHACFFAENRINRAIVKAFGFQNPLDGLALRTSENFVTEAFCTQLLKIDVPVDFWKFEIRAFYRNRNSVSSAYEGLAVPQCCDCSQPFMPWRIMMPSDHLHERANYSRSGRLAISSGRSCPFILKPL